MQDPLNTIGIGVSCYLAGIITGFLFHVLINKTGARKVENNTVVLLSVTVIWVISMVVDILSVEYETSPLVHALMGSIVGYFYKPKMLNDGK